MANSSPRSSDSNSQIGINPFLNESELQPALSDHSETISTVSLSGTPDQVESVHTNNSASISDVDADIESVNMVDSEVSDNDLSPTSRSVLARSHVLKPGKYTFINVQKGRTLIMTISTQKFDLDLLHMEYYGLHIS